jgi:hypothetical protein
MRPTDPGYSKWYLAMTSRASAAQQRMYDESKRTLARVMWPTKKVTAPSQSNTHRASPVTLGSLVYPHLSNLES